MAYSQKCVLEGSSDAVEQGDETRELGEEEHHEEKEPQSRHALPKRAVHERAQKAMCRDLEHDKEHEKDTRGVNDGKDGQGAQRLCEDQFQTQ